MMINNPISSLPQQNAPSSQPTLAKRRSSAGGQIAGNRGDNHTPTPTTSQQTGHQDNSHQYSQKHMASNQKAIARPHTANLVSRSARNSNPNLSNRAQSTTSSDVYENTERTPTGNQANGNFHQVRGHSSESVTRKDYQKAPFNHRSSLSTTAQKPPNFFSSKKSSLQRTTQLRKSGIFQGPLTPTNSNPTLKHSSSAKIIKCQGSGLGSKLKGPSQVPQYIKPSTPGAYLGGFSSTPLHYPSKAYMRNNHNDLQHQKQQQHMQQQYSNMQPGSRKYQAGMVVMNDDQNNNGSPQAHQGEMGSGVGAAIMMTSDPQSNGAETRKPIIGKGQTAAIQISPYNGVISMNEYGDVKRIQNSSSAGNLYNPSSHNQQNTSNNYQTPNNHVMKYSGSYGNLHRMNPDQQSHHHRQQQYSQANGTEQILKNFRQISGAVRGSSTFGSTRKGSTGMANYIKSTSKQTKGFLSRFNNNGNNKKSGAMTPKATMPLKKPEQLRGEAHGLKSYQQALYQKFVERKNVGGAMHYINNNHHHPHSPASHLQHHQQFLQDKYKSSVKDDNTDAILAQSSARGYDNFKSKAQPYSLLRDHFKGQDNKHQPSWM